MPCNCVDSADNVCYISGEVTFARQRKAITVIVKKAYHLYFECKIGDQDKSWAPHVCGHKCATDLSQWLNGKTRAMPFVVPMVWREPSIHTTDCYFCMAPPFSGVITNKKKWTIVCPNIPSALCPVPQGEGIPIPKPSKEFTINSDEGEGESTLGSPELPACTKAHVSHVTSFSPQPYILIQEELNDLVHDLELSKSKAELLGSRLKQWNLLGKKCPNFFGSQLSSAVGTFLQKGIWPCVMLQCRWPDECPQNQIWSVRMATVCSLQNWVWKRCCCILETNTHPFHLDALSTWKKPTKT